MDAISKPLDRSLLSPPLSATSSYEGQETLTEGIATRRSNHPFSVFQHWSLCSSEQKKRLTSLSEGANSADAANNNENGGG
jgi:hypothetical protein